MVNLTDSQKERFTEILNSCNRNRAVLMDCLDTRTGDHVAVLGDLEDRGDTVGIKPLAILCGDDALEYLHPVSEGGEYKPGKIVIYPDKEDGHEPKLPS